MLFELWKVDLIFAIFEKNLIPGLTGEHVCDFISHFALFCLDVLDELSEAVAADVPVSEIEEVVGD